MFLLLLQQLSVWAARQFPSLWKVLFGNTSLCKLRNCSTTPSNRLLHEWKNRILLILTLQVIGQNLNAWSPIAKLRNIRRYCLLHGELCSLLPKVYLLRNCARGFQPLCDFCKKEQLHPRNKKQRKLLEVMLQCVVPSCSSEQIHRPALLSIAPSWTRANSWLGTFDSTGASHLEADREDFIVGSLCMNIQEGAQCSKTPMEHHGPTFNP